MASLEHFRGFGRNDIVQFSFINSIISIFNNYRNIICQFPCDNINQKAKALAKQICEGRLTKSIPFYKFIVFFVEQSLPMLDDNQLTFYDIILHCHVITIENYFLINHI